ncbi:MAG: hypothetical protein ACLQQ4_09525 [Bacteroidia bacterium]
MSVSNVPMFTQKVRTVSSATTNPSAWTPSGSITTNLISVVTGWTNGSRVTGLILGTTDGSSSNVMIVLDGAGAAGPLSIIGEVPVAASAGIAASTPAVDGLSSTVTVGLPIDNNGKRFIHLGASDVLYVGMVANMTSGILFVTAIVEDY